MQKINISQIYNQNIEILLNIFKGEKIYMVGGCVRDIILNKNPKDIDFCTNLTPDQIINLIPIQSNIHVIEVGKSFGVIKLVINNEEFEVATFRKDIGEGRRPDSVEFTNEETDIQRRDLTINGLLLKILNNCEGELIDYCNGVSDIENKIIKTIGNPVDRFKEDPLRKLRAIRFTSTLNFELDLNTLNAIKENPSLNDVSPERIREEWIKSLTNKNCNHNKYLDLLFYTGLIFEMFPNVINKNASVSCNNSYLIELFNILDIENLKRMELEDFLFNSRFLKDEINDILLMKHFHLNINDDSFFHIIKKMNFKIIDRNDALRFFPLDKYNLINKFLDWKPWVNTEKLIELGFEGKKLGEEIKKLEFEKFKNNE